MLTTEEVIKKYGKVELTFSSYYKYSFSFVGGTDEVFIRGSYGGFPVDIYRYDVSPGKTYMVEDFEDQLHSLVIESKATGEQIFSYYDY